MASKCRVLFVCVHNAARSQMAEAYLNTLGGEWFEAESAGFEPTEINQLAVEVMREEGIDISNNKTDSVFDFFKQEKFFSYVITVCDESTAQRCPIFPGVTQRIHWSFKDPAALTGSHEEKRAETKKIRDEIKAKVEAFIDSLAAR